MSPSPCLADPPVAGVLADRQNRACSCPAVPSMESRSEERKRPEPNFQCSSVFEVTHHMGRR